MLFGLFISFARTSYIYIYIFISIYICATPDVYLVGDVKILQTRIKPKRFFFFFFALGEKGRVVNGKVGGGLELVVRWK